MMHRIVLGGLLCAAVALTGGGQAAEAPPAASSKGPVYKTPQAAYDAFIAAQDKGDFKGVVALLAPETQKRNAEELALEWVGRRIELARSKDDDRATRFKAVLAVLSKHGMTEEAVNKIIAAQQKERNEEKAKAAVLALIKDRAAFLVDVMAAMHAAMSKEEKPPPGKFKLTKVKIDGDKGKGVIVQKAGDREFYEPIEFVKIGGGWKVAFPKPKVETTIEPGKRKEPPLPLVQWKAVHTFRAHKSQVEGIAFSRDGKTLATCGNDKLVKLWDVPTRKEVRVFEGHKEGVDAVVITADGQTVASMCRKDTTVRIWDRKSGKEKTSIELNVTSLAISPDGKTLVAGTVLEGPVLIDVARGMKLAPLGGEAPRDPWAIVWTVGYSADGKTLASGGERGKITLWNPETKKLRATVEVGKETTVHSVVLSADARALFWAAGEKVVGWDVAKRKQLYQVKESMGRLALTPNGKYLTSDGDGSFTILDAATGAKKAIVATGTSTGAGSIAFSHDGKWFAMGGNDGTVRLFDASSLK
jgi:WD40 repeat protein